MGQIIHDLPTCEPIKPNLCYFVKLVNIMPRLLVGRKNSHHREEAHKGETPKSGIELAFKPWNHCQQSEIHIMGSSRRQ